MRLDELMERIIMSEPSDWHTAGRPTYRDKLDEVGGGDGQHWIEIDSHNRVAAFIPDVSITMAWGLTIVDDFHEPWANLFPDPSASSHHVDVFFNGALVYRASYVAVDGSRCYLPLPLARHDGRVPLRYRAFIALLDRLSHTSDFRGYFERAGLQSADVSWPFDRLES
jgi:hypothetical protein